ncbi:DUF5011 domain-containing protein, partial [Verrucomicrobia bacterium]|nr:DUF5011 domain-containing protein [Verrucomicrobiota bacterium]
CSKLLEIDLPDGLSRIPEDAFASCESLQSIVIPEGVTHIGMGAFADCFALGKISLPVSLVSIDGFAFGGCEALEEISIPEGVDVIPWALFSGCRSLVSITIPASVSEIQDWAFYDCNRLAEIIFEGNAPNNYQNLFGGGQGEARVYVNSGATGFGDFYSGLPVLFDPVVELQGQSAMRHRSGTDFVDPGASATDRKDGGELSIQVEGAVGIHTPGDYWLTYTAVDSDGNQAEPVHRLVKVVDSALPLIVLNGQSSMIHEVGTEFSDPGATAVDQNDQSISVTVDGSVDVFNTGTYTLIYTARDSADNVAVPLTREVHVVDENFKYLDYYSDGEEVLITDCDTLVFGELLIPSYIDGLPVTGIGSNAFADCVRVKSIILPEGLTNIQSEAFRNCHSLQSIVIPEVGVTHIGMGAFADCHALKTVLLPVSLSRIGGNAFAGCEALEVMSIPEGLDVIPWGLFVGCRSLKEVNLPSTLEYIESSAFEGCHSLDSITIPASVKEIQDWVFYDCNSLVEIIFEGNAPRNFENLFEGISADAKVSVNSGAIGFGDSYKGLPVLLDPIIELKGETAIRHRAGSDFVDPGASATDRKDGELLIQVEGIVGIRTPGDYWLTYTAVDSEGNQAEPVQRLVKVVDSVLPLIVLNSESSIVHEVGTQFFDPGATALDQNDQAISVTVNGSVDVFNAGVYSLIYNASDSAGNAAIPVTRWVAVVNVDQTIEDLIPPVITLNGSAAIEHKAGTTYRDAGATATDNLDPTVSVVKIGAVDVDILGSYTLTYTAGDIAGNEAISVSRTVNVVEGEQANEDLTPPVITLNGKAVVQHSIGKTYEDAGAMAIDTVNGVVKVTTSGIVDANKLGTYTLTYKAIDAAGNTSKLTRQVVVGLVTSLNSQSVSGAPESKVVVPIKVNGFSAISGVQFTLQWDPKVMTLVEELVGGQSLPKVTQSATIPMNGLDFPLILPNNFSVMGQGKVTFLWDEALQPDIGRTLEEGSTFFALHFNLVGDPGTTTSLVIGSDPTPYTIVPASGGYINKTAFAGTVSVVDNILVSGRVTLFGGGQTPVPGTKVLVDVNNESHEILTGEDGSYQTMLTPGDNCVLSASLKTDTMGNHGVDVSDIIHLRKHILNREKLSSTMAWLAADTNLDNSIDVSDIVAIRKMILNHISFYSTDANGEAEDMFRFTRLNFKDVDPLLSFTALPEALSMNYQSVSGNLNEVDFAAVKLGDANGDWTPPAGGGSTLNAMAVGIPQSQGDASIGFGSTRLDEDGSIHVSLNANASQALMGLELELSWDKNMLELEGMSSDVLSHFIPGVHSHEGSGTVKLAWDDATLTGTTVNGNEPVMIYRFRRVGEGSTGLFLEQALLAGENGILGRMQSASLFLGSGNSSRAGLNGAIKSIEHRDNQIELWVDTRGASSWQLESNSTLEASQ